MSTRFQTIASLALPGLLTVTACGPTDIQLEPLDITVTAPSGWSVEMARNTSIGAGSGEMKKGGKTYGFIYSNVLLPLEADAAAWPKDGPHTLAQLEAALAKLNPSDAETFERGFGLRYEKDGKPKFLYVVQLGERELKCTSNDWIALEDVPAAISICKSVRS
jgi:hypothetical protein